MQIFLKPLPGSNLAKLAVTQLPFCIGRHEDPFRRYPKQQVHTLSKRHASLIQEGDHLYLVDLGSANGTQCNGRPVSKTPARVRPGDVLSFGHLAYEVAVSAVPSMLKHSQDLNSGGKVRSAGARLVLAPSLPSSQLPPMVVRTLPFLVGRDTPWFAQLAQHHEQALDCLSAEHALLFIYNNKLFIDDLGSTNGTLLNSELMMDCVREVGNGDKLTFGSPRLCYQAYLLQADQPDPSILNHHQHQADAQAHTLFVDAPTEFIGSLDGAPGSNDQANLWNRLTFTWRRALQRFHHLAAKLQKT